MNTINNRSDIQGVLNQMRAMRISAGQNLNEVMGQSDSAAKVNQTNRADFSNAFKSAIDSVNSIQMDAGRRADAFVSGKSDDLVGVMVATQKSAVAFQAVTQVRNRLVGAYQEIMNMPI